MVETMDKIILKQVAGGTKSGPLYGEYQTFILDIDDQDHRLWLNKQYKQGAVMVAHAVTIVPTTKVITHVRTYCHLDGCTNQENEFQLINLIELNNSQRSKGLYLSGTGVEVICNECLEELG
jgi:hypothetical protein